MSISADGADRLAASLSAAGEAVADLREVNAQAGRLLADAAQRGVRRRTGRLAGSITTSVDATGVTVSAGGPGVTYAAPVESAYPFLNPAVAHTEGKLVDLYTTGVADAVANVKGT